jgi:putative endonuclease
MATKPLGDLGEKIAREYLGNKGYEILDRNFRYSKLGELDIIAAKNNAVHFFEVKTRQKKHLSDFLPEDNITFNKQKKIIKLAQIWLSKHKLIDRDWQIDVLAIELYRDDSYDIRHLENAVGDFH